MEHRLDIVAESLQLSEEAVESGSISQKVALAIFRRSSPEPK
jgi:hypothetical protein